MPSWSDLQPYVDKFLGFISDAAHGLGVAGQQVIEIIIRQEISIGVTEILGSIVVFVVTLWFLLSKRAWLELEDSKDRWGTRTLNAWKLAYLLIGGVLLFGSIIGFFTMLDGIQHLINPAFYGIQDMGSIIKSIKGSSN